MITALPHLTALRSKGLIQTKETPEGWLVRNPTHPGIVCLVHSDGKWNDTATDARGLGVLTLCDHLRLDHGAVLDSLWSD